MTRAAIRERYARLAGEGEPEEHGVFRCPMCAARTGEDVPLTLDGSSLRCSAGHTFNISRRGSFNTVPAQRPLKGYTGEFFRGRREFIEWGYYAHVRDALADCVKQRVKHLPGGRPPRILDAGCGEGYYLRGLAEVMPGADLFGADIAKDAIDLAARAGDGIWMVADVANLPVADGVLDCVLDVFTPANYREFRRILAPGGAIVKAIPGSRHMAELRDALGLPEHGEDEVERIFADNCTVLDTVSVTATLPVPAGRVATLFTMTPLTFSTRPEALADIRLPRITIDARILVGTPR